MKYPKVTTKKLEALNACSEGVQWFENQKATALDKVCFALIEDSRANWANWLIVRYMNKKQRVQYAIYAAEQVLDIFEKKYPEDKRPRLAIEAAKNWVKSPTEKNRDAAAAADAAAYAADAAAYAAAYAAADAAAAAAAYAADAATYAAFAATYAAAAAAAAAYAAADAAAYAAADAAAYAAYAAAAAARKAMRMKIIKYGLTLIQGVK